MAKSGGGREIAVIGIGCRFPGGVNSPKSFWELLENRVDAIGSIPEDRFDAQSFYDPEPRARGKISSTKGGFLTGIDRFDAAFFGISPREAEKMDPQHRILLEVAWEALEDAAIPVKWLAGSRTGVFVGLWLQDYEARVFHDPSKVDFHATTGTGRYAASGRISHLFDFQGPSITIDTACSSSLVAIHHAVRCLQTGDCTLALAGGANTILQPHITVAYSQSGMMAPDGRSKFGDAQADGYVRSEGAGIVVLKPLELALEDRDPIYAVIHGGAVNNDGRSGAHFVAPAKAGQEKMLRLAWADAGIDPLDAVYVEAHGTGTLAGDPVELGALGAVLGIGRSIEDACLVGSVKTNIGHTEGAAGVAGLIKTALALHNRKIPPSLHFENRNPAIQWDSLGMRIASESETLPVREGRRVAAGVSAFGIAGTNAHLVLGPAPYSEKTAIGEDGGTTANRGSSFLIPFSAHSFDALREVAAQTAAWLSCEVPPAIDDLQHTLGTRRTHHDHRIAVLAENATDLTISLKVFAEGRTDSNSLLSDATQAHECTRVVFVFPGQGSQWLGMGRDLLEAEPVFRASLERCEAAMRPWVTWSLLQQLATQENEEGYLLDRIDVIQPVLVALGISLSHLWSEWGIRPWAVVGHSMGEVAAAHVSGALSLEDAMRVICIRSSLLRRISGRGGMAMVELSADEVPSVLRDWEGRLSIAAANSPRSTVISGDPEALDEVLAELDNRDVFCRKIAVDVASHSHQVDDISADLSKELTGLTPGTASLGFISTVVPEPIAGPELDAEYWVQNLRRPVMFSRAVTALQSHAIDENAFPIFLEVSPHPVLVPAMEQTLFQGQQAGMALGTVRRDENETEVFLRAAGELWQAGVSISWDRLSRSGGVVRIPPYPWQRERFWVDTERSAIGFGSGTGGHPILGHPAEGANGVVLFQGKLDVEELPFLLDHRVLDRAVVPAASYLEMVLSASKPPHDNLVLEDVQFEELLELGNLREPGLLVQLVIEPVTAQSAGFRVFSKPPGHGDSWRPHARGRLTSGLQNLESQLRAMAEERSGTDSVNGPSELNTEAHYREMAHRGLDYGPAFRVVTEVEDERKRTSGRIRLPDLAEANPGGFAVNPILLDGVLQVALVEAARRHPPASTLVPVAIKRLRLSSAEAPRSELQVIAISPEQDDVDVLVFGDGDTPWMCIQGLRFARLPTRSPESLEDLVYVEEWEVADPPAGEEVEPGLWILVGNRSGLLHDLAQKLERRGHELRFVAADARDDAVFRELSSIEAGSLRGIVHSGALESGILTETTRAREMMEAQSTGAESLLAVIRAMFMAGVPEADRIWIVTRGARSVREGDRVAGVAHSTLWGMGAVLAQEHPRMSTKLVDIDDAGDSASTVALEAELLKPDGEQRIAYRNGIRHVARLVPSGPDGLRPAKKVNAPPASVEVETEHPGFLDSLVLKGRNRSVPRERDVEIEVAAAGLNFLNVMSALGICPGYEGGAGPLGIECAGVISAVGRDVVGFSPGDRVAAFARNALSTHALADAHLVIRIPENVSFEEAATVPIAFLTAFYGLEHLAHLREGETVLIHSAAGGVGMAAMQLARNLGARILATAGTEEKRHLLRDQGLKHVFDSRSLDFAEQVRNATGGKGVDVILNSLAGEAIDKGLEALAPYGRFVELGKRDIYDDGRLPLRDFRRNLSYFAVDLDRASREKPGLLGEMLKEIGDRLTNGIVEPLQSTVFDMADAADAFRTMAGGRHVGKVVVRVPEVSECASQASISEVIFRDDASYLITGGLGALGITVSKWAIEHGARTLVLVDKNAPSESARSEIAALRAIGIRVVVEQADVSDENEMAGVLSRVDQDMPPLKGILHVAGLLDDGILTEMDTDTFRKPLVPKLAGAWVLHRLTAHRDLDEFVMFSSVAGLLGTPGQANYAAGNAFLDSLACFRVAKGLPATSVAWGPWGQIGLAAVRDDRGSRLESQGLGSLDPDEALSLLGRVLVSSAVCPSAMRFDSRTWRSAHPAADRSPFLMNLRGDSLESEAAPSEDGELAAQLRTTSSVDDRKAMLRTHLRERLSEILRLPPDKVQGTVPFKRLGMDSLMTLELRNRLESDLGSTLSATAIWNYPTLEQLTGYLLDRFQKQNTLDGQQLGVDSGELHGGVDRSAMQGDGADHASLSSQSDELESIDQEDLESLLDQELSASDELLSGS